MAQQDLKTFAEEYLKAHPNATPNEINAAATKAGIMDGKTFKDVLDNVNSWRERNEGILGSIGKVFGSGGSEVMPDVPVADQPTKILGMRVYVAIPVFVVTAGLIAFGIYKLVNRKK